MIHHLKILKRFSSMIDIDLSRNVCNAYVIWAWIEIGDSPHEYASFPKLACYTIVNPLILAYIYSLFDIHANSVEDYAF